MTELLPRALDARFATWAAHARPKPMLLRGPRQVGKSSLVRGFAKRFDHYIELNLENERDRQLFDVLPEADPFLDLLFLRERVTVRKGESVLLFIDEIQQAPIAIQFLRYLYEDQDRVKVIAAGSLLEFALGRVPSMPVGRIELVPVFPLSFEEFLIWTGRELLAKALDIVPAPAHFQALFSESFREYTLIGGMPEVVKAFAQQMPMQEILPIFQSIWTNYTLDLERHTSTDSQARILRAVLDLAPFEHDRFSYANFGGSTLRSREVKEALELLKMARVLKIVEPTTAVALPATPNTRAKPRLQFMDTGLLNFATGLLSTTPVLKDISAVYRGRLGLHIVTQEIIAAQTGYEYEPHFWIRENKNANAEVDLVYRYGMELLALEVKSGPQGRLRSLHQFVQRAGSRVAVRALDNVASVEQAVTPEGYAYTLVNVPLYAASRIGAYVAWGLEQG